MAESPRNLIVLSDGTGNSAAKQNKTNVWRLYQALALGDGSTQLAEFGDGVGTSSVTILRVLGLALGVGVKRNVLNLYKFLCRNYKRGDCIWAFGFSRGAFTIRVLLGLIHHEGLVSFHSEAELNRNALAAYRAYRKKAFPAGRLFWIAGGRSLRDRLISAWNFVTGERPYGESKNETVREETVRVITEEAITEEVVREEVIGEEVIGQEVIGEEVVREEVTGEEVIGEEVIGEEVIREEAVREEVVREEVVREEVIREVVIGQETVRFHRDFIKVHFVGLWDTVAAYGLPIDELTTAVDKWVWPMKFRGDVLVLLPNVEHARHALSLDDERRSFHPTPWDETGERWAVDKGVVKPGRLRQVWFAGTHSDVGGGYPDDGLSFVALRWMIDEAAGKGLHFEPSVVKEYAALAAPTGRIYDLRSGFGALYRYQPRDAQTLLNPPRDAQTLLNQLGDAHMLLNQRGAEMLNLPHGADQLHDAQTLLDKDNTPLVHGSVMTRIVCGDDGYAPISLPEEFDVLLPPDGAKVAFKDAAVTQALAQANPAGEPPSRDERERRHILMDTQQLLLWARSAQPNRTELFNLVRDTVWWRRIVYFVSLVFVVIAVAFPPLAQYLRIEGVTEHLNDTAGAFVRSTVGFIKGFLPGFAEPWVAAVVRYPAQAAIILICVLASLGFSLFLQRRIRDRARDAWEGRKHVGDDCARSFGATLCFSAFAGAALMRKSPSWLLWLSFGAAIVCGVWWAFFRWFRPWYFRRFHRAENVEQAKPVLFLPFARWAWTTELAVDGYRCLAQKVAPFFVLGLSAILAISSAHRAWFDMLSTGGHYCTATQEVTDASPDKEILGAGKTFETRSMCHATGLRLIAGRKYRIQLDMDEGVNGEWFDKGIRTDVAGFTADSMRHYMASPLKRWWRENWFQPIARIGDVGNYEHVLQPAAPLPVVPFEQCRPKEEKRPSWWEAIRDIPSPATAEFKNAQLACEAPKDIRPNRTLISDITADATGELFLYVNDAVLTLPGWTDVFYKNNSGTAKVTVTRILADVIE